MPTLDEYVEAFEDARHSAGAADLRAFLPPEGDDMYPAVLRELVRIDMEMGWGSDAPRGLEYYRADFPSLFSDRESLQEIAFEEYRLRKQAGQHPRPEEYASRYGVCVDGWPADEEQSVFLSAVTAPGPLFGVPEPGSVRIESAAAGSNTVAARRFRHAGAEAVVERSPIKLPEAGQSFCGFDLSEEIGRGAFGRVFLARQEALAGRPVALKVAPDVGPETRFLARLQHTHIVPVYSVHKTDDLQAICMPYQGRLTLAAVVRSLGAGLPAEAEALFRLLPTPCRVPAAARDYPSAALWLAGCLADALTHAHERGILHRDIKPANVLITDDGVPMLLDFNVGEDVRLREPGAALMGGTLPYMSPEQLEACRTGVAHVDARCDVYSLGVVLFELLTGRFPFPLVRLAADEAGTQAAITMMLADRRKAPPSPREHNPAVSPAADAIVRKCLEADPARRYASAADLREDIRRQLEDRPLLHAAEPWGREAMAKWWRRSPVLRGRLVAGAAVLFAALAVFAGHSALTAREAEQRRVAAEGFKKHFRHAQMLLATRPESAGQRGEGEKHARDALSLAGMAGVTGERGDLLLLLARSRLEAGDLKAARAFNDEAADVLGDTPAVWAQRADILDAGYEPSEEARRRASAPPSDIRGRLLLARERVGTGRHHAALALLGGVLEKRPDDFWAMFLQGLASEGVGRDAAALEAYTACIALAPDAAGPYVNRGLVLMRRKEYARAEADFTKALGLAPGRLITHFDRALARESSGDLVGAMKDIDAAMDAGLENARLYFARSRIHRKNKDELAAKKDWAAGIALTPTEDLDWVARGVARRGMDPEGALKDMEEALKLNPSSRAALMGQANIWAEHLKDQEKSSKALARVLELYPDHVPALAGRAVVLARLRKNAEAQKLILRVLEGEPDGEALYQAGCVYALTGEPAKAVARLRAALNKGFGWEYLPGDPDLDPLRGRADFEKLLTAARMLKA